MIEINWLRDARVRISLEMFFLVLLERTKLNFTMVVVVQIFFTLHDLVDDLLHYDYDVLSKIYGSTMGKMFLL